MEANLTDLTNISTLYVAIILIALTTVFYFFQRRGLPPGPTGLPYLGYWPFLSKYTCHLQLHELVKKYGDVFSFTATGRLYINLGSLKANREAFITKSEYFADRVEDYTFLGRLFQDSILFLNGEAWKANRKFFVLQFKERGMSTFKEEMSGHIFETIKNTIEELRKTKGQPVDMVGLLTTKCSKVLYQTAFGETGVTEQEIADLIEEYGGMLECITGPNFFLSGNFARYFIQPFLPKCQIAMKKIANIDEMLYKIIDRHRATFDEGNVRNLIDAYFKEKKIRQSKNDPSAQYFTDRVLVSAFNQFVGDGILTVAAYISTFFQALLEHPEEQDKIYKELIEVVGVNRDPSMDDKSKLPYTNAFIAEVTRTCDAFPFFPKMECTREVTLRGYRIPKGALTIMDIHSSHFDPEVYEEPEKFNPSRFLSAEGKKKAEQPILFGMGKRSCIGEAFAMAQVFLFMTSIVKHFRLSQPDGTKDNLVFLVGGLHICAHPRSEGDSTK